MASAAETCYGLALQLHNGGSPGSYTSVAEVTNLGGFGLSAETADITSMESTSGVREFKPTLLTGKDVTFNVNFLKDNATHDNTSGVLYLLNNRTYRKWKVLHSDTATTMWEFYAYVVDVQINPPLNGVWTGQITLRPTGAPITQP